MSETTNLKLFKHDNPENNEEIFNIESALNENWDKIDESTKKIDDNITEIKEKDIEQDKLIEELKEENQRLKEDINSRPSKTLSGGSIDINDSAEMRFKEFKISGNSKQEKREGYNLLANNLESKTINGVSITVNKDKSITLDGTCSQFFQMILLNTTDTPIILQPDTYTISYKNKVSGLNLVGTENGSDVPYLLSSNTQNSITKTYSEEITISKVVSAVSAGTVFSNLTVYPMIYKGTSEKEYEQYGVMPSTECPSEIKSCGDNGSINIEVCNKNFIESIATNVIKNGVSYNVNNDKTLSLSGTNSLTTGYDNIELGIVNIKVTGNYCFSGGKSENIYLQLYSSDWKTDIKEVGTGKICTLNPGLYYVRLIVLHKTKCDNIIILPQLEKGIQVTEYELHKLQKYTIPTQQLFRKIEKYKDTFIKKEGKWYERHYIEREMFNGTESFTLRNNKTKTICFGLYNSKYKSPGLSNYFKYGSPFNSEEEVFNISSIGDFIQFNIEKSSLKGETVNDFKNWIKEKYEIGTPIYIDYILGTPKDIECTVEQTEILNKIENKAKNYKGITHIYSTDPISPNIEVTYFKDIEIMINNIQPQILSEEVNNNTEESEI